MKRKLQQWAIWTGLGAIVVALVVLALRVPELRARGDRLLTEPEQTAVLEYARAVLQGEESRELESALPGLCGQHVFVQLFRQARTNYIYAVSDEHMQTQQCLPEAIRSAVKRLQDQPLYEESWQPKLNTTRLGVSIRSGPLQRVAWKHYHRKGRYSRSRRGWRLYRREFEPGLHGVLLKRVLEDEERLHWVPAMEMVAADHGHGDTQTTLRRFARHHLRQVGVDASRNKKDKPTDVEAYSFPTQLSLESAPGDATKPLSPVRGNFDYGRVDADDIYRAAVAMTDYLVRVLDDDGQFDYEYYANKDRSSDDYNIVRHAGTTYSLFVTHHFTGDEKYLEAGHRAKRYIIERLKKREYQALDYHQKPGAVPPPFPAEDGSVPLLALVDGDRARLGSTALTLLAFARIPPESLSAADQRRIEQMVNFVWYLQCESGGFYDSYKQARRGKCPDPQPLFYPGETLLALNTLYQVDPNPAYLDLARRSVRFEIERFYSGERPDHWVMQALELLQENLPEEAADKDWVQAGWDMGWEYLQRQYLLNRDYTRKPQYPEFNGAMSATFGLPNNSPTGSLSEAVAGIYRLMRNVGYTDKVERSGDHLLAAAHLLVREMYRPENMFFLANPEKALGGLPTTPIDQSVRIDANQHALVALWGAWQAAIDRNGIGWPLPSGPEGEALQRQAEAGELITEWGALRPKE